MRPVLPMLAILAVLAPSHARAQALAESQPMEFEACKRAIDETTARLGVQPLVMVATDDTHMVRWITDTGMMMTTCSRLDGMMVTTGAR